MLDELFQDGVFLRFILDLFPPWNGSKASLELYGSPAHGAPWLIIMRFDVPVLDALGMNHMTTLEGQGGRTLAILVADWALHSGCIHWGAAPFANLGVGKTLLLSNALR